MQTHEPLYELASCSNCGSSIEQGDAFCGSCGARIAQAPSAPPAGGGSPPSSFTQSYAADPRPGNVARRPLLTPDMLARVSPNGWILCGGAAAVVIASLLPWVALSSGGIGIPISSSPPGSAPLVLIALAAGALGLGWPSIRTKLSKRRLIGLAVVAGVLSIFVVTNWTDLSHLEQQAQSAQAVVQVSAGSGLYLYTVGVMAMWVCVVRAGLLRRRG
jgi:hypothetical protein